MCRICYEALFALINCILLIYSIIFPQNVEKNATTKNTILKFLVKEKKKDDEIPNAQSISQFIEEKFDGQTSEKKVNNLVIEPENVVDLKIELAAEKKIIRFY